MLVVSVMPVMLGGRVHEMLEHLVSSRCCSSTPHFSQVVSFNHGTPNEPDRPEEKKVLPIFLFFCQCRPEIFYFHHEVQKNA